MPTYLPPRKGVRISEAYAAAAVSAPVQRAMLSAYELWHPTLAAPVRVVHNPDPIVATLEATAPRNPGEAVEFFAAWVQVGRLEESDGAASPEIQIQIDNVSGPMSDALDVARGSRELWEVIERVYASDDLSGPAQLPVLRLTLTAAGLAGPLCEFKASHGDPVNIDIPSVTFIPEEYPGITAR